MSVVTILIGLAVLVGLAVGHRYLARRAWEPVFEEQHSEEEPREGDSPGNETN